MQFSIPTTYLKEHLGAKKLASIRAAGSSFVDGAHVILPRRSKHATVACEPRELIFLIGHDNAQLVWAESNLDMSSESPEIVDHDEAEKVEVARIRRQWRADLRGATATSR